MFEQSRDGRRPGDLGELRQRQRPLSRRSRGEAVVQTAALRLRLPVGVFLTDCFSQSGARRRSQHLQDVRRFVAQVLPGPLPGRVSDPHISVELAHEQLDHLFVAVDGSDMERRLAAGGLRVDVEGQTELFNPVPETRKSNNSSLLINKCEVFCKT